MSLEETIVTAPRLHQEKGNIPVLEKSFIYIWLHHIKIIVCLVAVFVQVRLKPFCGCPSLLTERNTSSERPSDLDSVKFTDELQVLQNTLMPLWIHLLKRKIWNELDSFSTRSRCSKAFWCQLTEAANEEGWRASGGPFETGAPRLSHEEAWYPSQLICVAKERMRSATQRSAAPLKRDVKYGSTQCPPPDVLPSQLACHHRGGCYCVAWWNCMCQGVFHSSKKAPRCSGEREVHNQMHKCKRKKKKKEYARTQTPTQHPGSHMPNLTSLSSPLCTEFFFVVESWCLRVI